MIKKKLYQVLLGLICCYLSSGIALSNKEFSSVELTEPLSHCIGGECEIQLIELPNIEIPSEREQIVLYKKIYTQYNNSEFDYKNTHMEGLEKILEIMYCYFNQHLENPLHKNWLAHFWTEATKVISAKELTYEYFIKDFEKLVILKYREQKPQYPDDRLIDIIKANELSDFTRIYSESVPGSKFYNYNSDCLTPYFNGVLKKFPFIMPIFKEDGILSLESLIEQELDSEDLLYCLLGVQTKIDTNDCTGNSNNILSFINHDFGHFIGKPEIRYIIHLKMTNGETRHSFDPREFIFHYLLKFIYNNQHNFTKADLVSMFILLHEYGLFQGFPMPQDDVKDLTYIKDIANTAQFHTFWKKYSSYNMGSELPGLISEYKGYFDFSNRENIGPFDLMGNDNDTNQGFDEDGYYFYVQSKNEGEFLGRDLTVIFKIQPTITFLDRIAYFNNRNCTLTQAEVEVIVNEGSDALTPEELEYFKEKQTLNFKKKHNKYCSNEVDDRRCCPICAIEEINLLNYAYEGKREFSESMLPQIIDMGMRDLKEGFFEKYADLFRDPVVQQKIQADLLKICDYMSQ